VSLLASLHDQNKISFCGGPAFIKPVRAIYKVFKDLSLIGWKKAGPLKKPLLF